MAKPYDLDERISEYIKKSSPSKLVPQYQVGSKVKVRITRLVDFGAFVVTMDPFALSGLIHNRHIPKEQELHVGQVIEAKVKEVKEDNKIEFRLDENLTVHEAFADLEVLKEKLPDHSSKVQPPDETKEIIHFLSKEFGIISDESKKKVEEMVNEVGVFRFTLSMMKILPVFKRDLVYHFLKEVEQVRDSL
ncbi:S1 RNA-binding domain-containing protein [Thermoactinomyces sp. CICC 10521]|uniref:S1 RNA-binding domain-containing protein n=1 Tax=Thermoactinomyces sp. CICC 10521 TaxID=2767426 RepID=UPI0018DBFE49|nr:S1 RNA-binding domain-containing protein [Thermoactinomyces sp. CICC 10521]MBH8608410.1 S1 RNA-binding domain-containing protein [Thermoactinomyces sp. CICC 10521]